MHLLVLAEVPTFTVDIYQNPIAKNYRDVVGVPSLNQIDMTVAVPFVAPRHAVAQLGEKYNVQIAIRCKTMNITVAIGVAVAMAMVRLVGVGALLVL